MQTPRDVLTPDALAMLQSIAKAGSFAAAARDMGMVPSALTYRVRQIEDALDVLLFDRCSRQARMTDVLAALTKHLEAKAPWGVEVTVKSIGAETWWMTNPSGPVFEKARRAFAAGFGREAVYVGCGGSIPFVGPFAEALGGVPALLIGVEDPLSNAHGENESLSLVDFEGAIRSSIHLFHLLGE